MHMGIFLHPYTLENKFEGAFNDFVRLHCPTFAAINFLTATEDYLTGLTYQGC